MSVDGWDWLQHVVDHLELHASDYDQSVRFYATVLTPLRIPCWSEDTETERLTCFTRISVVDRRPATTGLHLCFVAKSRDEVDAFHQAGVDAGFSSNVHQACATTALGTTPRFSSTRMATTSRRSTVMWETPDMDGMAERSHDLG